MLKKLFNLIITLVITLTPAAYAETTAMGELTLTSQDRILVLAPHPDDEVLGVGGVLQRAVAMKLPVKVVFFTHGDSNPWSFLLYRRHPVFMPGAVRGMGLIRRDEAVAASSILGVEKENLIFLGYPDFGTMNIWYAHWNDRPPLRSILTRVTQVPYQGALRPGALYKGEEIVNDLRAVLRDFRPTKIFVSHPADHNGDHLSLYLYTRVAIWDELREGRVEVYPYLIHYLGWPKPGGYHPELELQPPEFLRNIAQWRSYQLSPQEFELKKAALQAHKTQYASSPKSLLAYVRPNELFGDFPILRLHHNEDAVISSIKRKFISAAELPDEFNSQEKESFIGVEWKFVRWEGNNLVVSIELSRPLAKDVEASIYIFGYSRQIPFKRMPKLNVRLGVTHHTVYDQSRRIAQDSVHVQRSPREVTITVPLNSLGNPDRILTSARTYLGKVPLDSVLWVAVELL